MALVYALIAKSSPDELRYIGKTCDATSRHRRNSHIREAKKNLESTYKLNWIRKVLAKNDKVLAIILESNLTEQQSFIREKYWIAHYRSLGHRLTNATDGGDGSSGYRHTEEDLTKMRGYVHTRAARTNISIGLIKWNAINGGKLPCTPQSPETRKKIQTAYWARRTAKT